MNLSDLKFYVYAYIRKSDGTPYYVGKGTGYRAYQKKYHSVTVPSDRLKIIFFHENISNEDASRLEKSYIKLFGRKDLFNGILLNKTDGGEGVSGRKYVCSLETAHKISKALLGKTRKPQTEEHRKKLSEALLNRPKSALARKSMSEAKIGSKLSNETKDKIKKSLYGNKRAVKNNIL